MNRGELPEAFRSRPAMMKVKTLDRLRAGIAALTARGDPVAAKTIERETGLTFQTIRRNEEAYRLFCEHADYFRNGKPAGGRGKPSRSVSSNGRVGQIGQTGSHLLRRATPCLATQSRGSSTGAARSSSASSNWSVCSRGEARASSSLKPKTCS